MDNVTTYRIGDLKDDLYLYADKRHELQKGNKPLGVTTGLVEVDKLIGGAFEPGLYSINGSPGVGKTAFALQIACQCGFPALFVTCEMAPLELLRRIIARTTGTCLNRLKNGEFTPDKIEEFIEQTALAYPDLSILDLTRGYIPAFAPATQPEKMNIFDEAEAIKGDNEYVLVIIDSLHSYADKAEVELKEYESLNLTIASLQALAAKLNSPVIAIAERNRQSMNTGGQQAGAGTRKIEYSAEAVFDLNYDTNVIADNDYKKDIKLTLTKNRNGDFGKPITLKFYGARQEYSVEKGTKA